jgi:hypothetical protein
MWFTYRVTQIVYGLRSLKIKVLNEKTACSVATDGSPHKTRLQLTGLRPQPWKGLYLGHNHRINGVNYPVAGSHIRENDS